MRNILIPSLLSFLLLTSCAYLPVYQPDVQQGNVITSSMVNQLYKGMTPSQVKRALGQPLLKSTFTQNRLSYVYTFKSGRKPMLLKYVSLTFRNGRLVNIEKTNNIRPTPH